MSAMKRIVVIQRVLTHYRVPFFEQLRDRLAGDGVTLDLLVGQSTTAGALKGDEATLSWATQVKNRYLPFGRGNHLVWQPVARMARKADLVVVEQASRLLVNYVLLANRRLGGAKVAFWGHGVNLDRESASRIGEAVKRSTAPWADWWFCYTAGTAQLLAERGISRDRMTVVQNAIDVRELQTIVTAVTDRERHSLNETLGVEQGPVALCLGSIYPNKRPQYLIEAADEIKRGLPGFHLIVVGDGPSRAMLDAASVTRDWLHPVGMLKGKPMAAYASIASVLLNPGLVGLSVLDAFALTLPMVTCDLELHSPEIEYLRDGYNGVILPRDTSPKQYGEKIVKILTDEALMTHLRWGCIESADEYSIESMVENFANGVLSALAI